MNSGIYGAASIKSSAVAYLAGRGVSALLTFAAFALAARILALDEYGAYMLALAMMELAIALSTGGLDWVANRFLPECRIHASGATTCRFVLRLGGLQTVLLCATAVLLWLVQTQVAVFSNQPTAAAALGLAAALVCVEGVGRLCRDQFLGILMLQRQGQAAQVVRALLLASLLGAAWWGGVPMTASQVLQFELAASGVSALLGLLLLGRALLRMRVVAAADPQWRQPAAARMASLAAHMYGSYLLALAYGPQVLTVIVSRVLGADAVALYGFARTFADQVRRYLPTDILQSVIRPSLVAYYSSTHDFQGLALRLGLWFKSSLVAVVPLVVVLLALREQGSALIGGARYTSAWPLLVILVASTAGMALRRVTELACNAVMAPQLCLQAAAPLLFVPLIAYVALSSGLGLVALGGVVLTSEFAFSIVVIVMLQRRGYRGVSIKASWRRWFMWSPLLAVGSIFCARWFGDSIAVVFAGAGWLLAVVFGGLFAQQEKAVISGFSPRIGSLLR